MASNDRQPKKRKHRPLSVKLFLLDPDNPITKITKGTCSKKTIKQLMQKGCGPPQRDLDAENEQEKKFPSELTHEEFKQKLVEIYPKLENACFVFMKAGKDNTLEELNPGTCCYRCYTPENVYHSERGQGRLYIRKIPESEISLCTHGIPPTKMRYVPIQPKPDLAVPASVGVATASSKNVVTSVAMPTNCQLPLSGLTGIDLRQLLCNNTPALDLSLSSIVVAPPESTTPVQNSGNMLTQEPLSAVTFVDESWPPVSVFGNSTAHGSSPALAIDSGTETIPPVHSSGSSGNIVTQSQVPTFITVSQAASSPPFNSLKYQSNHLSQLLVSGMTGIESRQLCNSTALDFSALANVLAQTESTLSVQNYSELMHESMPPDSSSGNLTEQGPSSTSDIVHDTETSPADHSFGDMVTESPVLSEATNLEQLTSDTPSPFTVDKYHQAVEELSPILKDDSMNVDTNTNMMEAAETGSQPSNKVRDTHDHLSTPSPNFSCGSPASNRSVLSPVSDILSDINDEIPLNQHIDSLSITAKSSNMQVSGTITRQVGEGEAHLMRSRFDTSSQIAPLSSADGAEQNVWLENLIEDPRVDTPSPISPLSSADGAEQIHWLENLVETVWPKSFSTSKATSAFPDMSEIANSSSVQRKVLSGPEELVTNHTLLENVKSTGKLVISLDVLHNDALWKKLDESTINIDTVEIQSTCKTLEMMKERCELFQKEMERFSKKRLGLDGEKKESKAKKIVSVVGPMTNFLIDIGGRLAIIVSVPTLGIVTAFAGAALAAVTRTVTINDYRNNSKTRSKVKELYKVDPVSMILTILKEVGIELSRIFEEQLFTLRDNKDVTVLACCAVNLMLKFKGSEKFDRNTLLRNVLLGKAKTNPKVKMRNNKSLRAQDFFQQTGLRKVSLRGSEFKETYLSHCNLTGVNAQSCTWTTTKVLHSCADDADLRCGVNGVGGNSWEGTSLENAQVKGEPSLHAVTNQVNQPEPTNADEEQGNGIATVSPMLDTSSANNNPLPRPIEDTSPSVPSVTNQPEPTVPPGIKQKMEGQLSKWTNLMKGWQYRWFVLNSDTGHLEYYVDKSKRTQGSEPWGSVYLVGAVIAPSDEDSVTFSVNAANGDLFKLRACDARERQQWINKIRMISELVNMLQCAPTLGVTPSSIVVPRTESTLPVQNSGNMMVAQKLLSPSTSVNESRLSACSSGSLTAQGTSSSLNAGLDGMVDMSDEMEVELPHGDLATNNTNSSNVQNKENELQQTIQRLGNVVHMQAAKMKKEKTKYSGLLKKCTKLSNHNVHLFTKMEALKKSISREKDKDGKNKVEDSENFNQAEVPEPFELVGFVNPFNCESSCGFSAIYFILKEMGLEPCNAKLIMKMLYEAKCEVGCCRNSLTYLCEAGLVKEEEEFSAKITNDYTIDLALQDLIEKIKDQSHPALLLVDYDDEVEWKVEGEVIGHCVVVMPDGTFIDVHNERYWKPETDRRISCVTVLNVNENTLKDWKGECELHNCKCEVVPRVSNSSSSL